MTELSAFLSGFDRLNSPTKRWLLAEWIKKTRLNYMLSTRLKDTTD